MRDDTMALIGKRLTVPIAIVSVAAVGALGASTTIQAQTKVLNVGIILQLTGAEAETNTAPKRCSCHGS